MRTIILLSTALLQLLAAAAPLDKRAGAPTAKPIPNNCTIINPLPHSACGTGNVDGYMPKPGLTNTSLLYQSYFDGFLPVEEQAKQCRHSCYGYGNPGDCKASFLGYNVPTPAGYYGSKGGDLNTACLLFTAYLNPNSFVQAPEGQYVNATAASIYCPAY